MRFSVKVRSSGSGRLSSAARSQLAGAGLSPSKLRSADANHDGRLDAREAFKVADHLDRDGSAGSLIDVDLAGNANRQAAVFAAAVEQHPSAKLEFPVEANEAFVSWTAEGYRALEERGVEFLMWPGRDDLARFVFSHCTTDDETTALCQAMEGL